MKRKLTKLLVFAITMSIALSCTQLTSMAVEEHCADPIGFLAIESRLFLSVLYGSVAGYATSMICDGKGPKE